MNHSLMLAILFLTCLCSCLICVQITKYKIKNEIEIAHVNTSRQKQRAKEETTLTYMRIMPTTQTIQMDKSPERTSMVNVLRCYRLNGSTKGPICVCCDQTWWEHNYLSFPENIIWNVFSDGEFSTNISVQILNLSEKSGDIVKEKVFKYVK